MATAVLAGSVLPAAAAPRGAPPRADSLEYRRSWGLSAIGAQAAFAAGYSGRGVRVALVDCGVQARGRDLKPNLSAESADLAPVRFAHFQDNHGDWVAQPLGSSLDGYGVVGLAYNATLLEIRADMDGGFQGQCAFWPKDVAQAIDYAVARRARIIVLPMQAQRALGPAFEAALTRAVGSGAVLVVAAGNDNAGQPSWPARYAADARFAGSMVVAGAATFEGDIARWSNRAGETKTRYVLAPGEWILTDCSKSCSYASGTSFSAPYVAGAIALMMEAHPKLSGPEAAERILKAAREMGATGADPVYGRGMLDLTHAFESEAKS